VWGKCLNAGQTCVAPDYVLVDRRVRGPLVEAMRRALDSFFPNGAEHSPDYGRIIHRGHFDRLLAMMKQGTVLHGGRSDAAALFMEPTLLGEVPPDSPLMEEEIFGPLLPVREFGELDEALALVRARPDPLALYLFTKDRAVQRRVQRETRSGGMCVNDVLVHLMCRDLPFGGRGESGMGASHGKAGFDAFSHARTVLRRAFGLDFKLRYPPIRAGLSLMKRMRRVLLGD
jgi:aldehyde dehydrogenase (NAD+)